MKEYKNFISLGYNCYIALDLRELGLRDTAGPFDWCTTPIKSVVKAIESGFANYLDYNDFCQMKECRKIYKNIKTNVLFPHDFNGYCSFSKQYKSFREKYEKHIRNFYQAIKEPTLFVRYVARWEIEDTIEINDTLRKILKSFNEKNEVIYICSENEYSRIPKCYYVFPGGDVISHRPLQECVRLKNYFLCVNHEQKLRNLKYWEEEKKKSRQHRFTIAIYQKLQKTFLKEYVHKKEFSDEYYKTRQ